MKKKILPLLLTMLALSTISFAQGGFHLGVKGGVNLTKVDGKSFKQEFKHGYNLGAFAEINFNDKWGLQPELLWNQSVAQTSDDFSDIYSEGIDELKDVTLNYVSIPLLLSFKPSKFITLQAGPQFGILLDKEQNLFENGRQAFKSGDFSLLGGVQLNFAGAKVGGRYVVGLANINDIDNKDQWKNQGFQLYVGFRLF